MINRFDLRTDDIVGTGFLPLSEATEAVNKYIYTILHKASPTVSEITSHISEALGKGIRTSLLLNAALTDDGCVPPDAVKAAAAIELLHLATLVHDDIIDDAPLRRGIESVQAKFGKKEAVICGDYLLCMSMSIVSSIKNTVKEEDTDLLTILAGALSKICLGELNQFRNIANLDLDLFTYLRIISNKTAALFYVSAFAGALVGGSDRKQLKDITRFGYYLGIIFQVMDDCKDYELSENQAKKPVKSDIANGIVTLPLIMAMRKDRSLREAASDVVRLGMDPSFLINEVCRLGGTEDSRLIVGRYDKKARLALSRVNGSIKNNNLLALLNNVTVISNV